jgi:hypothetical protein
LLGRFLGNSDWSLLAISNGALLGALFAIHFVAERRFGATEAAVGIWTLCFIPAGLFFSLPYTESLFLLTSTAVFLLADLGHPVLAGIAGVPAALTRVPGALLALPVAMHRDRRSLPVALLPPLGLGAVMIVDFIAVGDPLGFLHSQIYWHGPSRNPLFPVGAVVSAFRLRDPFHPEALGLPVLLLFTAAALWLVTRPATRDLGVWSLMLCALAAYQGYAVGGFQSVPRYLVVAFPCYLAFGHFLAGRRVLLVIWLVVSAVYLTETSALFGSGQFVG